MATIASGKSSRKTAGDACKEPGPTTARTLSLRSLLFAALCAAIARLISTGRALDWVLELSSPGTPDPARGYFPVGCRWREAGHTSRRQQRPFWAVTEYEYWNETVQAWSTTQPPACRIDLTSSTTATQWSNDSRTSFQCFEHHCTYKNLWYNAGRMFYLSDDANGRKSIQISHDVEAAVLSVNHVADFPSQVDARLAKGDTLIIDFVYFLHPTAIGHWLEHLMPLISVLRIEPFLQSPTPTRVVLLHLKRSHVFEWVRAALAAALGVEPGGHLPPVLFQEEVGSVWSQIGVPLEGVPIATWVCLEHVIIVKDTFMDGGRVALTPQDAQTFRRRAYELHYLKPPASPPLPPSSTHTQQPPADLPRRITLLHKSANRRIINEAALLKVLNRFGEVQVLEFTDRTPVADQLTAMSSTSVLISPHTSGLANAVFLPPGAAVVELIQRNWVWDNLDRSFFVQTRAMGDIHHFAWRATKREHVEYINPRDAERFGGEEWAGLKCDTDECTEAHTKVDIIVDIAEIEALLEDRLPLILKRTPIEDAALPWPAGGEFSDSDA